MSKQVWVEGGGKGRRGKEGGGGGRGEVRMIGEIRQVWEEGTLCIALRVRKGRRRIKDNGRETGEGRKLRYKKGKLKVRRRE